MVGPSGLEPPTSCLSGTRSNLLSYEPLWLVSDFYFTWYCWDSIRGADYAPWSPTALTVHRTVIHFRLCSNPFQYWDR